MCYCAFRLLRPLGTPVTLLAARSTADAARELPARRPAIPAGSKDATSLEKVNWDAQNTGWSLQDGREVAMGWHVSEAAIWEGPEAGDGRDVEIAKLMLGSAVCSGWTSRMRMTALLSSRLGDRDALLGRT